MAWYTALLPFAYLGIGLLTFVFGFLLVYRNLRKINLIEGEKFTLEDWLSCVAFGAMFAIVVVFATNLSFDVVSPGEIPSIAGYLLLILLAILVVYPLWEAVFLGRPTSDAVHEFHKFLENKILDRFKGKVAYLISFGIFVVIYIVPIVFLSVFTAFEAIEIAFMWFLIFPLFFLNYYAASGQVSNIVSTSYRYFVPKDLVPEKPKPIKKILALVFMILAWLPFILSIYNIYGPINLLVQGEPAAAEGGESELSIPGIDLPPGFSLSQITSYLSLLTTVVFGIQGFFKRYWNKKSKTKTIDFIFSGYIFIGIGVNMLINFSNIDRTIVDGVMSVSLGGWQPLLPLAGIFDNAVVLLPLVLIQSIITVTYGSYLLLNRGSDFQADLRLSSVNKAFGIKIDQLVAGKKLPSQEKGKPPKYDLPTLFKSVTLPPIYTSEGTDLNFPVREKAAQFLFLISVNDRDLATTIVDVVAKKAIEKDKSEEEELKERKFVSKEAVDLLGNIGKVHPDLVVTRLMNALGPADTQIKRFILDAFGDIGESKQNLPEVIDHIKPLLVEPRYEVRIAAFNTLIESVTEGEYDDQEFVETILLPIYEVLESHKENADIIDTALDSLVKMCVKVAEFIDISKIIPFLDYPAGRTERIRGFIVQNAISILAFLVYYNMDAFPVTTVWKFLDDKRSYVRYVAVDAIGNYILKSSNVSEKETILLDLMNRSLHDSDPDVTEMCTESVTEFLVLHSGFEVPVNGQKMSVLSYYAQALESTDAKIAENASEAMKSIAPLYQADIYPILVEKIKGNNPELTRDCLHTLGLLGEHIHTQVDLQTIYGLTSHEDATIRAEALFALGGISETRADVDAKIMFERLEDTDPEVRLEAIFALGKLGLQHPREISQVLIEKLFAIDRESSARVSEVELYAESLGVIGEAFPSNEIIISLQQALMGDTNVFAKDIIAKSLGRIGNGMIKSGNATRTIESEAFYNVVSWLSLSKKREYTIGNLIIIFIEALQQKGIPESVMNIISDSIQDLLPVFVFRQSKSEKRPDEIMLAIKDLLAQAYYSNYDQEILETIDRVDSLLNFKRIFETEDPFMVERFEFYSTQYTPDGKQFHDQGEIFLMLEQQGPEYLDYAQKSFEIAIDLAPNEYYTPNCYLQRGIIFKKKGMLKEAKEQLEEALESFTALDEVESMKICEDHLRELK